MHWKRSSLIIPLVSASLLSGCAAHATGRDYAPAPQALIEAAEQASQMRMVYADIQARSNGHTIESVRLDSLHADAPDFMRAKVRLDYNGPMENVLSRVANDIGYRLNEYGKPASGLSWTPWVRLSGSKPLLDHMREMNSQVPWHIVLDHRDRRLVVDYSDDGGMAAQIRQARENRRDGSTQGNISLPSDRDRIAQNAQQAAAQTLSNGPTLPRSQTRPQVAPEEVWFVAIEGYESNDNARSMVIWLAQLGMDAYVHDAGQGSFDVRVIAETSRDAVRIRKQLEEHQVPSQLGYEEPENNEELKRRAEIAMRNGWPVEALETSQPPAANELSRTQTSQAQPQPQPRSEPSSLQWQTAGQSSTSNRTSNGDHKALAESRMLSRDGVAGTKRRWAVQLAFSPDVRALGKEISRVEGMGFDAALIPHSGNNYLLRAIDFQSRSDASSALSRLRSAGFSDAYLVSPEGV